MRFLMLMYPSEKAEQGVMPDVEGVGEMMKYNEQLAKAGILLALDGLHPSSKGARITWDKAGKPSVTDGPFTETKEVLGGFTIIEARDLNEALRLASKFASALVTVEVRPLLDAGAALTDPLDQKIAAARRQQPPPQDAPTRGAE